MQKIKAVKPVLSDFYSNRNRRNMLATRTVTLPPVVVILVSNQASDNPLQASVGGAGTFLAL